MVNRGTVLALGGVLLLTGCTGNIADPQGEDGVGGPDPSAPSGGRMDAAAEAPLRRLNRRELANTLEALLGQTIDGALDGIPGDSRELVYDRMGASQTVSALHVEGFFTLGEAVTDAALADDALLGRLLPGCDLSALGPRAREERASTLGASLVPPSAEYVVCYAGDDWSGANRCPEVTDPDEVKLHFDGSSVTLGQAVPSSGTYRIEIQAAAAGSGTPTVVISETGGELGRVVVSPSPRDARVYGAYGVTVDLAGGDHDLRFTRESPDAAIYLQAVSVIGPIDTDAAAAAAERHGCIEALVSSFAPRAWRRPLSAEEEATIAGLFREGMEGGFYFDGLRMALLYLFQAPELLYHVELGAPTDAPGVYRLDDFEVASRLSYLAWEAPPDDALWEAATRGELRTPAQVRAQAERLFADPRARETVRTFYEQWLALDELERLTKDVATFPEFTSAVRVAMREETRAFMDAMIWEEGATVAEMLVAPRTWLPPDLASIYGVEAPASLSPVTLPEGRLGLLTQPSLLAINAKPTGHSPVRRGVFVLERILCEELPTPPPDVDFAAPERSTALTTRERFGEHTSNPACSGCHQQIDTIGFTFESFDSIGRFQTHENGVAIDSSGGIPALGIEDGALSDAVDLSRALADSGAPDQCLTRQWLRFALGREERASDARSLEQILAALETGGVREMLVESVSTEAFLYRTTEEAP